VRGKTLLAMEFLVRGATEYGEPGVFMAFEETAPELAQNVRSLGFDLDELAKKKKLAVDFVRVERSEIDETGDYDLEGLFIRLNNAIEAIGARRVVLDTIENLFSGLQNEGILRAELRRLFLGHAGTPPSARGDTEHPFQQERHQRDGYFAHSRGKLCHEHDVSATVHLVSL
jgi:KaiC/GvpD/RAD55 family RecA-like ATPase